MKVTHGSLLRLFVISSKPIGLPFASNLSATVLYGPLWVENLMSRSLSPSRCAITFSAIFAFCSKVIFGIAFRFSSAFSKTARPFGVDWSTQSSKVTLPLSVQASKNARACGLWRICSFIEALVSFASLWIIASPISFLEIFVGILLPYAASS